jgi:hypothetical protein
MSGSRYVGSPLLLTITLSFSPPQRRDLEPDRPLLLVDQLASAQGVDHLRDLSFLIEGILVVEGLEHDADRGERLLDVREDLRLGLVLELSLRGLRPQPRHVRVHEVARDVLDVLPLVVIRRELHGIPQQFQIPEPDGISKDSHLAPGVIEVILAFHRVPGPLEEIGRRVAEDRPAAVADGQRTRRVRTDELHLDLLPGAGGGTAERGTGPEKLLQLPEVVGPGEKEVDESRTRHLHPGDKGGIRRHRGAEGLRQVARLLPGSLRRHHRAIGREIAMPRLAGGFE